MSRIRASNDSTVVPRYYLMYVVVRRGMDQSSVGCRLSTGVPAAIHYLLPFPTGFVEGPNTAGAPLHLTGPIFLPVTALARLHNHSTASTFPLEHRITLTQGEGNHHEAGSITLLLSRESCCSISGIRTIYSTQLQY